MIPKPTTRDQARRNAIEAAEEAHIRARGGAPVVWARVSEAWSAIAETFQHEDVIVAEDVPEVSVTHTGGLSMAGGKGPQISVSYDLYCVLKVLAIRAVKGTGWRMTDRSQVTRDEMEDLTMSEMVLTYYPDGRRFDLRIEDIEP
jgi:hypothetical protein